VFGSGPHVIRGIERYKNHLIAYSLGNFAGWHNFGLGGNLSLSGLLTVRIDGTGRIRGGRWLSLYVSPPGVPGVDRSNTSAHLVSSLSPATSRTRTGSTPAGTSRGGEEPPAAAVAKPRERHTLLFAGQHPGPQETHDGHDQRRHAVLHVLVRRAGKVSGKEAGQ